MNPMIFNIQINAPAKKVWDVLFGTDTYPQWTAVFAPGSTVDTDWQKGSRALFHDGTGQGMIARIEENTPYQFLSIKHLGEIKNGVEDFSQDWGEALENYTLEEQNGVTSLTIHLHLNDEWRAYFEETWPKALEKVKELAEGR